MTEKDIFKKKLHSALKLSGFAVRREFCSLIVDKFLEKYLQLEDSSVFDSCVKNLCANLEKQCLADQSIEKEHIDKALEVCLNSGYDKHETVFNVIGAFEFPKLQYDLDRKLYLPSKKRSMFVADARFKSDLFNERYMGVLQRTQRNFRNKVNGLTLQTVDYLLTSTAVELDSTLVLGALLQVSEGKYFIEDPSGMVELDLSHAKYHGGFFVENSFVLVNGYYEDKILRVSTMILPPGEEYKDSRMSFINLNYFGGMSPTLLRESTALKQHAQSNSYGMMLFFSDIFLDDPQIFDKLELLFDGTQASPPIAFIFMGSFLSDSSGAADLESLRKYFRQLGELVERFPNLVSNSQFVFVPSMTDPSIQHTVPRMQLPSSVTSEFTKFVRNAVFTTNPCRIQYCNREIVVFRADVCAKLMQGTLHKPDKDDIGDCVGRTIVSQGHLSPFSLNALTVHWAFDYTLRLYPLPDLVIIGDKSEAYSGVNKGCTVVNPGSFCNNGFQFKCYTPFSNTVDDCAL